MAKMKPEEPKGGVADYMATYGDLVTLLLCFFVLLFASSNVDAEKYQAMASSFAGVSKPVNGGSKDTIKDLLGSGVMQMPSLKEVNDAESTEYKEAQAELAKMASDFKTYVADQNLQEKVSVKLTEDSIVIDLQGGLLFDTGKAELRPQAIEILDTIGDELAKYSENSIQIEGHTDNVPVNTPQYPSNWYLSSARAIAVGSFLQDVKKISPQMIEAVGRGEYAPVVPNDSAEHRAQNRRVEIKIKSSYASTKMNE